MAKKLVINCATCDARNAREENYAHYESITVNCAMALTSPQGKTVLNKLPFTLNCGVVLELPEGVKPRFVNGRTEIKMSDSIPEEPYFLVVNGSVTIGPHTENQLEKCQGMQINGTLTCPESMYPHLKNLKVNGATLCYPDGAIVLKGSAVIDKIFVLRAKKALYWASRRLIFVDPALEPGKLAEKGATFSAPEVIIAQSLVEELIPMIDERAEIVVVPDGTSVVLDDVTLDETTLGRYGKQLYIIGDVTVPEDGGVLGALTYLNIRGDARVPEAYREQLLGGLTDIGGQVRVAKPRGAVLSDKPFVKITRWMLEQHPQGLEVTDSAIVTLAPDIPRELIADRLFIRDCGMVKCTPEQEDGVNLICEDVGMVGGAGGDPTGGMAGGICKSILQGVQGILDTKVVNAAEYVL